MISIVCSMHSVNGVGKFIVFCRISAPFFVLGSSIYQCCGSKTETPRSAKITPKDQYFPTLFRIKTFKPIVLPSILVCISWPLHFFPEIYNKHLHR